MNTLTVSLSDDTKVDTCGDDIIEFHINYGCDDYNKIKKLCQYNTPFDVILIWEEYKNIKYGILLNSFIMENTSRDIGLFSTFYGSTKSSRRISNKEYKIHLRKNKIKAILDDNSNESIIF